MSKISLESWRHVEVESDDRLGGPVGDDISGHWSRRICTQTGVAVHERSGSNSSASSRGIRKNKHESWADLEVEGDAELNDPSSDDVSKYWSRASPGSDDVSRQSSGLSSSFGTPANTDGEMGDDRSKDGSSSFCTPTGTPVDTDGETGEDQMGELVQGQSNGAWGPGANQQDIVQQFGRSRKKIMNKRLTRELRVQGTSTSSSNSSTTSLSEPVNFVQTLCKGNREQGSDPSSTTTSSSEVGDVGDGDSSLFDPETQLDQETTSLGFPSVGSALHVSGHCKPCVFVKSTAQCYKGIDCTFCHMHHKRSNHPRPSKAKRSWYKRLIERSSEHPGDDEDLQPPQDPQPPANELPIAVRPQDRAQRRPDAWVDCQGIARPRACRQNACLP